MAITKPTVGQSGWGPVLNDALDELDQRMPVEVGDILTGPGDLMTADSDGIPVGVSPGADGSVLTADSGEATGLAWSGADGIAFSPTESVPASTVQSAIEMAAGSADPGLSDGQMAAIVGDSETDTHATLINAFGGSPRGPADREYGMVLGVLRNTGSPDYWQPIDDEGHSPTRIGTVVTTDDDIYVNYADLDPASVGTVVAVPDEALTRAGFHLGLSVAVDHTRIEMYRRHQEIADYIYYDTDATWKSQYGHYSAAWTTNYLTLTHAGDFSGVTLPADVSKIAQATQVGGGCQAFVRNATATTVEVLFTNFAGSLITSPATTMKIMVTHGASTLKRVDAQTVNTTAFPGSNIWLLAVPNL